MTKYTQGILLPERWCSTLHSSYAKYNKKSWILNRKQTQDSLEGCGDEGRQVTDLMPQGMI